MDYSYISADAETDGIKASVIWMLGIENLLTGEYKSYVGADEIAEACYYMSTDSKMIVGHNFLGYDAKVIKERAGVELDRSRIVDTCIASRKLAKELPNHKLETWGDYFGLPKLKSPIFEHYTPEMVPYCHRDVNITTLTFNELLARAIERDALESLSDNVDLLLDYVNAKYYVN